MSEGGRAVGFPESTTTGCQDAIIDLTTALNPTPQLPLQPHSYPVVWFLSPETWQINYQAFQNTDSFASSDIMASVHSVQTWLERWVSTGSNPFIHPRLYKTRFPACVQIAFTTLSSYIHRTAANTELILDIVNERAEELVGGDGLGGDGDMNVEAFLKADMLEKLARVHALIVYQSIGLFDGNIRSRYLAEGRVPILDRWIMEMVEYAALNVHFAPSQSAADTAAIDMQNHPAVPHALPVATPVQSTESLWYLWILSESVRRTWQIGKGMETCYLLLQQGWAYCPGGTMFTTRRGVWEAESALKWKRLCEEKNVRLVKRWDMERFFAEESPEDVDEFAMMLLASSYGQENMETWSERVG